MNKTENAELFPCRPLFFMFLETPCTVFMVNMHILRGSLINCSFDTWIHKHPSCRILHKSTAMPWVIDTFPLNPTLVFALSILYVTTNLLLSIYSESQIYEYKVRVFKMSYYIFKIKSSGKMSLMLIYQLHLYFRAINLSWIKNKKKFL